MKTTDLRSKQQLSTIRGWWLSIAVGIGVLIATGVLWMVEDIQERQHLKHVLANQNKSIALRIRTHLQYRVDALRRMANRWSQMGQPDRWVWEQDAAGYVEHFGDFQALEWVDPSYHVRWVVPLQGNEQALDLNLAFEPNRLAALESAKASQHVTMTQPIDLVQGGKGFLVYCPIYHNQAFEGFILGVFRFDRLLEEIYGSTHRNAYRTHIQVGKDWITPKHKDQLESKLTGSRELIKLYGVPWIIDSSPSGQTLSAMQSLLKTVTLAVGAAMAVLLVVMTRQAQVVKWRSVELLQTNERLSTEISERQQAQEKVRANEQRLMLAIQGTSDGLWDWLDVNKETEWWSPRFYELLGYKDGEVQATLTQFREMLHPDDVERIREAIRAHFEEYQLFDLEYRLKTKEGEYRWFRGRGKTIRDVDGKPLRMAGSIQDITTRKQVEDALRASENRKSAILESALDCVVSMDHEGKIIEFNRAAEGTFGYRRDQVIGQPLAEVLVPPSYRDEHTRGLARYLATGESVVIGKRIEIEARCADGRQIPVEMSIVEIRQDDGTPVFTGFLRDISERQQAEEALRASENRLILAVRGTSDGLWDWDIKTNAVWYAPRFKELLGYGDSEEEFPHVFESFESRLHPEDKEPALEAIRRHLEEDEPYDVEYRLKTKEGEYRWFRARGMAQRDAEDTPTRMAGSIQDIQDQKRAQEEINRYAGDLWRAREEIRASQKRFEIAVDGASDGLWDWDIAKSEVWYSHRFKALLGYMDKDFQDLFESWKSVIHPDHRQSFMEALNHHLETSQPFDVEYRAQTKHGEYRWYRSRGKAIRDKSGKAVRMAGSIQDITDQKKSEEQLRQQATAMSSTLEGIAILDPEGRYTYMNQAHAAIYGYNDPAQLLGQSWQVMYNQNEIDRLQSEAFEMLSSQGRWQGEVKGKKQNGMLFDAGISLTSLDGGELVCVCRDITDRKHAQAELAQRALELEKSNKELDDFAYIASHDLKEPLRGIHNYATFMIEDYQDRLDEEGFSKLQTLQKLTQRMELLIDTLLQFSRVGRVDLAYEEIDLNQILSEVVESLRLRLDEIGVDVRTPMPLPTIRCDRARIGEVFRNLITNAMKYNDKPDKWIEIGFDMPEAGGTDGPEQCVFYVRDNGIGIPEKHKDSIFRIFKRLHGRDKFGGGTGAGLTIVKKIVERHGGHVWVESTHGEGTTFKFTLGKAA